LLGRYLQWQAFAYGRLQLEAYGRSTF